MFDVTFRSISVTVAFLLLDVHIYLVLTLPQSLLLYTSWEVPEQRNLTSIFLYREPKNLGARILAPEYWERSKFDSQGKVLKLIVETMRDVVTANLECSANGISMQVCSYLFFLVFF